jgi:DNA-binding XRE family transcriptional regulator
LHSEAPDSGTPYDLTHGPFRIPTPGPKSPLREYLEELGERFRRKRGDRSLEDIAFATGISETTLKRIEKGQTKPKFETLLRLATALGPFLFKGVDNHPRRLRSK